MGKFLVFMLSLCRRTNGQMDRRTKVKQYPADLSIRGHKKKFYKVFCPHATAIDHKGINQF